MFRSPESRASPRIPKHQVLEGPIHDFTSIIESTVPEDWQKRTSALQTLVSVIPKRTDCNGLMENSGIYDESDKGEQWYNSPPVLRHLALPISELLKDARSSVVKRTCASCSDLFATCKDNARYLLKDMMPAIIQVHGSTVAVIRNYIQNMVVEAIAVVPCKMAMPLWLDRLKHDKSRTVREACCLYLYKGIEDWSSLMEDGYLTRDIYNQVGAAFIKALLDASPQVRQQARKGLEVLHGIQPDVFDRLIANDRECTKDLRVNKLLQRIQAGEVIGDDVSVASLVSRASVASAPVRGVRAGTRSNASTPTRSTALLTPWNRKGGTSSGSSIIGGKHGRGTHEIPLSVPKSSSGDIPMTIGVTTKSRGLGPPQRIVAESTSIDTIDTKEESNTSGTAASAISHPIKLAVPFQEAAGYTPNEATFSEQDPNQSFDTTDTDFLELEPITSITELRQIAKSRGTNSHRSSLLQNRLMRSASSTIHEVSEQDPSVSSYQGDNAGNINIANLNKVNQTSIIDFTQLSPEEIANHPNIAEHTKIAHQLLEAHKLHVDQIMEALKVEMDALKDFEFILMNEGSRGRPSEEDVLEYFESLGLCLEQRQKAGQILLKKMDRISKGK